MANGKHSSDEGLDLVNIPWKKVGIVVGVIIVLIILIFGGKTVYSTFVANSKLFKNPKIEETNSEPEEEGLPTILYGYKVLGKLNIESKNFSNYILDVEDEEIEGQEQTTEEVAENSEETTEEAETEEAEKTSNSSKIEDALKKGLVKLYGQTLNSKGNFCIIGHNTEEYFSILNELEVSDKFSIQDTNNEEKNYIITDIYTIEPTDLKSLMPNEKYTEVTLITCTAGSNQRLIVKALEENDYNEWQNEDNQTETPEETENIQ